MRRITLPVLLLMALLLGACGFTAPRSDEGFADLDSLGICLLYTSDAADE